MIVQCTMRVMDTLLDDRRQLRHSEHDHVTKLDRVLCDQGRGYTWVAWFLDVDYSTVWRWAHASREFPRRRAEQLAEEMHVEVEDLIGGDDSSAAATPRRRVKQDSTP